MRQPANTTAPFLSLLMMVTTGYNMSICTRLTRHLSAVCCIIESFLNKKYFHSVRSSERLSGRCFPLIKRINTFISPWQLYGSIKNRGAHRTRILFGVYSNTPSEMVLKNLSFPHRFTRVFSMYEIFLPPALDVFSFHFSPRLTRGRGRNDLKISSHKNFFLIIINKPKTP